MLCSSFKENLTTALREAGSHYDKLRHLKIVRLEDFLKIWWVKVERWPVLLLKHQKVPLVLVPLVGAPVVFEGNLVVLKTVAWKMQTNWILTQAKFQISSCRHLIEAAEADLEFLYLFQDPFKLFPKADSRKPFIKVLPRRVNDQRRCKEIGEMYWKHFWFHNRASSTWVIPSCCLSMQSCTLLW